MEIHPGTGVPPNIRLEWEFPFGSPVFGDMVGTRHFPALRLDEAGVLPLQGKKDDFNCGIGLVSAIGIVLHQFIHKCTTIECRNLFRRESMVVEERLYKFNEQSGITKNEFVSVFPTGVLEPLPKEHGSWLLSFVKAEWFILFDRLAETQHGVLHMGLSTNEEYNILMEKLRCQSWPQIAVDPKLQEEPTNPDVVDLEVAACAAKPRPNVPRKATVQEPVESAAKMPPKSAVDVVPEACDAKPPPNAPVEAVAKVAPKSPVDVVAGIRSLYEAAIVKTSLMPQAEMFPQ